MKRVSKCFAAIVEGILENMKLGRGKNAAKGLARVMNGLADTGKDVDFVGVDMTNEWDGVFINLKFKVVPQYVEDERVIEVDAAVPCPVKRVGESRARGYGVVVG